MAMKQVTNEFVAMMDLAGGIISLETEQWEFFRSFSFPLRTSHPLGLLQGIQRYK